MTEEETTLCDYVEYAELEDVKARVRNPTWICKACGRAANSEKYLCEPIEL